MRPTFDIVAEIIALTCEVPRERITPDSNLVNDLGIDSLDLLDITFAVDDAFGLAKPIDQWLHALHMGRISSGSRMGSDRDEASMMRWTRRWSRLSESVR